MKRSLPSTAFQFVNQRQVTGSAAQCKQLEQYLFTDYRGIPTKVDVPPSGRTVFFLEMSPDKSRFAAAHGDHTVRIYCAVSGALLSTKEGHPRSLWCLQFHPYNPDILASSCLGGELRIWDLSTGLDSVWRNKQSEVIASLSFHPKENLLAAAAGNDIVFYNWKESQLHMIWRLSHSDSKVRWLKFSSLGDALFTGICNRPHAEVDVANTNYITHPSNQSNLHSMYYLIRKKWSHVNAQTCRSPSSDSNRNDVSRSDSLVSDSGSPSSSSHNLTVVARSLFSNSVGNSSILNERELSSSDIDMDDLYECPVAVVPDTDNEIHSSQSVSDNHQLCHNCAHREDKQNEDSISPKRRKVLPSSGEQESRKDLSSIVDSLIPGSNSTQSALQSLNPDNSTFECLELFKKQMDAREQTSVIPKSKFGRLEQQIYGQTPSSSSRNSHSSLFSRLTTPIQQSASSSLNQSTNISSFNLISPISQPPNATRSNTNSNEERNRPRPVQVLPADALVEPPHPSSFIVRTTESQHLDTPIFSSPSIETATSSRQCRDCGTCIPSSSAVSDRSPSIHHPGNSSTTTFQHSSTDSSSGGDNSLHANRSDPMWMSLESRLVGEHPDYAVRILDQTVNMAPPIRQMINQTLANVVFGRDESVLNSSLHDCSYKVQYWSFNGVPFNCPGDLSWMRQVKPKLIVPSCKIHNDSSISLSSDSRLLAAFVPAGPCQDESVLSVYSCLPGNKLGQCLYTKKFGPNAISVEFSSANDLLLVGLASRRIPQVLPPRLSLLDETLGQVYRLHQPLTGEKSMRLLCNLHHTARPFPRSELSINGIIWSRNAGVIYATNSGSIFLMQANLNHNIKGKTDHVKTVGTQTSTGDESVVPISLID